MKKEVILLKKHNLLEGLDLLPQEIVPRELPNDILEEDGYEDKKIIEQIIALPLNKNPQKLFLYYEGEKGGFISEDEEYCNYFLERGYRVLENPAPSLLVDATAELLKNRQKFLESDLIFVHIVLISTPPMFTKLGSEFFLYAQFNFDKGFVFGTIAANTVDCSHNAFLLQKL